MTVAVISLSPVSPGSASEQFTLNAIQSVRDAGDRCDAFVLRESSSFVHTFDGDRERELQAQDVLGRIGRYDAVWIHQYLASELLFDILNAATGDVILTSLGDETAAASFPSRYKLSPKHRFVQPNELLSLTGRGFHAKSLIVPAGIWSDAFSWPALTDARRTQCCTLDGMSPASELETIVKALPSECSLVVVGARPTETEYLERMKGVYVTTGLPETCGRAVLRASAVTVCTAAQAEPFASSSILQAVASGSLPVASDSAANSELMRLLELNDLTFAHGDSAGLRHVLDRVLAMPDDVLEARTKRARDLLRLCYLWDDYWPRVKAATGAQYECSVSSTRPRNVQYTAAV